MTKREAFQKWAGTHDMDLQLVTVADCGHLYSDCNTDYAWLAWQASRQQMAEEAAAVCDGLRDDQKEADALELFQLAQTSGRSEAAQLNAGEFWMTVGAFNGGLRRAAQAIRSLATTGGKK